MKNFRHGRGDPCGRPQRGHAKRTCQEDMCCGDSRPVSPQATLFSEISFCRNHHILLSSRCFSTGCFSTGFFFDRLFFLINMVACGDTGRAKLATHVLLACPLGGRPQGLPLHCNGGVRQWASSQLLPKPLSAMRGTASVHACSISSMTMVCTRWRSDGTTLKLSSSCTCSIIFDFSRSLLKRR